jgi:aminoglycoside 2''-phosphotransferase
MRIMSEAEMMSDTLIQDLGGIAAGLQEAFPELSDIEPLTLLAIGANSVVTESQNGYLFRIGRNCRSFESYEKESRLLPVICDKVDIAVPVPEYLSGPTPMIRHGAIGYPKLPGRPLSEVSKKVDCRRVAYQLGEFAYQLHKIPVEHFKYVELPEFRSRPEALSALWKRASCYMATHFTPSEFELVHEWVEGRLRDEQMQDYGPCLIHGDLSCWNILVDESASAVSGIVDFEFACIGDPAEDLLTQHILGQEFFEQVLSAYRRVGGQVEPSFEHRVLYLRVLRLISSLVFHAESGDDGQLSKCVRKLCKSILLVPPIWIPNWGRVASEGLLYIT